MAENESAFIRVVRSALNWGDIFSNWNSMADNYLMDSDVSEDEKGRKGFEKALKAGV